MKEFKSNNLKKKIAALALAVILLTFIIRLVLNNNFSPELSLPELLFISLYGTIIIDPLVINLVIVYGMISISSFIENREDAVNKYRTLITFFLPFLSLMSIPIIGNNASEWWPDKYYMMAYPITIALIVTGFIGMTMYIKRYYPYSLFFASLLLIVHYSAIIPIVFVDAIAIMAIPVIIVASATRKELGKIYPIIYSFILGAIVGIDFILSMIMSSSIDPYSERWGYGITGILYITALFIIVTAIITVILFASRSKSENLNRNFTISLKAVISLIIFLVVTYGSMHVFRIVYISDIY